MNCPVVLPSFFSSSLSSLQNDLGMNTTQFTEVSRIISLHKSRLFLNRACLDGSVAILHILEWMKASPGKFNFPGNHHSSQRVFSVPHCQYCSTKKSRVKPSKLKIPSFLCVFFGLFVFLFLFFWVINAEFFSLVLLLFNLSGPFSSLKAQEPETCCSNEKKIILTPAVRLSETVNTTSLTTKHECCQHLTKQLCANNTN